MVWEHGAAGSVRGLPNNESLLVPLNPDSLAITWLFSASACMHAGRHAHIATLPPRGCAPTRSTLCLGSMSQQQLAPKLPPRNQRQLAVTWLCAPAGDLKHVVHWQVIQRLARLPKHPPPHLPLLPLLQAHGQQRGVVHLEVVNALAATPAQRGAKAARTSRAERQAASRAASPTLRPHLLPVGAVPVGGLQQRVRAHGHRRLQLYRLAALAPAHGHLRSGCSGTSQRGLGRRRRVGGSGAVGTGGRPRPIGTSPTEIEPLLTAPMLALCCKDALAAAIALRARLHARGHLPPPR